MNSSRGHQSRPRPQPEAKPRQDQRGAKLDHAPRQRQGFSGSPLRADAPPFVHRGHNNNNSGHSGHINSGHFRDPGFKFRRVNVRGYVSSFRWENQVLIEFTDRGGPKTAIYTPSYPHNHAKSLRRSEMSLDQEVIFNLCAYQDRNMEGNLVFRANDVFAAKSQLNNTKNNDDTSSNASFSGSKEMDEALWHVQGKFRSKSEKDKLLNFEVASEDIKLAVLNLDKEVEVQDAKGDCVKRKLTSTEMDFEANEPVLMNLIREAGAEVADVVGIFLTKKIAEEKEKKHLLIQQILDPLIQNVVEKSPIEVKSTELVDITVDCVVENSFDEMLENNERSESATIQNCMTDIEPVPTIPKKEETADHLKRNVDELQCPVIAEETREYQSISIKLKTLVEQVKESTLLIDADESQKEQLIHLDNRTLPCQNQIQVVSDENCNEILEDQENNDGLLSPRIDGMINENKAIIEVETTNELVDLSEEPTENCRVEFPNETTEKQEMERDLQAHLFEIEEYGDVYRKELNDITTGPRANEDNGDVTFIQDMAGDIVGDTPEGDMLNKDKEENGDKFEADDSALCLTEERSHDVEARCIGMGIENPSLRVFEILPLVRTCTINVNDLMEIQKGGCVETRKLTAEEAEKLIPGTKTGLRLKKEAFSEQGEVVKIMFK